MAELAAEYFTDPLSHRCWAVEPTVRRLQYEFPDIAFEHRLVVRFPEMTDADALPDDIGDREALGRECAAVIGPSEMPLREGVWSTAPPTASRPACVAVTAVRDARPDRAAAYFRLVREAMFVEGTPVDDLDALADLADRVRDLDGSVVRKWIDAPATDAALQADMRRSRDTAASVDAGALAARGDLRTMPVADRLEAEGDETMLAPPAIRLAAGADGVIVSPEAGADAVAGAVRYLDRDARSHGDVATRSADQAMRRYLSPELAESFSDRDYVAAIRRYLERFERAFLPEIVAGIGASRATCADALRTLERAGEVQQVHEEDDGWMHIEARP